MKGIKRLPLWTSGIVGGLLFSYCQFQPSQTATPLQPENGEQFTIAELTDMLIEVDALGDRTYEPEYTATLQTLDVYCPERPQKLVLEAMNTVKEYDQVGTQYAVLNELDYFQAKAEIYRGSQPCLVEE